MSTWTGQPSVRGNSEALRMVFLTCVSIGITFTWGVEMTYCTPYLLSLGLTKGQTSMVWLAGPISGMIVQPVIGVMADSSTSKWGRRRPIIVAGSIIVALSLLTMGFTKEIVAYFGFEKHIARALTIFLAVLTICSVDFSINAVMSCARSLVVDTLPMHKQQVGAAWSSRMGSLGHIIGYGMGALDLVDIFGPTLGDTQFKQLTIIAAMGMLGTSAITCWAVSERVLITVRHDPRRATGSFKVVRQIWSTIISLPPRIRGICWAVFWSWIGWFPFLMYSSTWVGETYFRYDVPANKDSKDALGDMGRIGSTALTVYSTVHFVSAWVLPALIRAPVDDSYTHRPPASIARWVETFHKVKPDLLTAWVASHILFAFTMSLTPFASSYRVAALLVAVCGIPWSIVMWAPATFMGIEVNKLSGNLDLPAGGAGHPLKGSIGTHRRRSTQSSIELLRLEHGDKDPGAPTIAGPAPPTGELSGIYFGIMNIYTTIPQLLSTLGSAVVFGVLEPGKSPELATDALPSETHSTDGPNAIAVCMFFGAISSVMAAVVTKKLKYI